MDQYQSALYQDFEKKHGFRGVPHFLNQIKQEANQQYQFQIKLKVFFGQLISYNQKSWIKRIYELIQ
ncbi:unnamed protein product [Paramecium sonneborni]|uniref:Uncharacterized protein n=1 Tax=Paramecium sonneborni TaxID=65129 RepID=A0A8S1KE12_9CILI|nr:unnamed protein product [Paramecium sonneborni]